MFQSSPVPEDGCNAETEHQSQHIALRFNPHPSRRTGATGEQQPERLPIRSFNPHPSRRTGATFHHLRLGRHCCVSILTRPGGRVQRVMPCATCRTRSSVSILTRPEGRVQLGASHPKTRWKSFQSSPVPKDGCNVGQHEEGGSGFSFQSSPVPKDGCNRIQ